MGWHFWFQFLFFVSKKFLKLWVKGLRSDYFEYLQTFEFILNRYTAVLIHVCTRQFPRQIPTYIEKKDFHVGKKVAEISFVWHPDTLFQLNDISIGTSLSFSLSLVENTVNHIHFQNHRLEIRNQCRLVIIYLLVFLAYLNSLDTGLLEHIFVYA